MLILLRGAADVLFFTPAGELMGRTTLAQDRVGVIQIPQGKSTARWLCRTTPPSSR